MPRVLRTLVLLVDVLVHGTRDNMLWLSHGAAMWGRTGGSLEETDAICTMRYVLLNVCTPFSDGASQVVAFQLA